MPHIRMQTIKGKPIFHQTAPGRRSTPALYTPSPLFALPSSFSLLLLLASLLTLFFFLFFFFFIFFLDNPSFLSPFLFPSILAPSSRPLFIPYCLTEVSVLEGPARRLLRQAFHMLSAPLRATCCAFIPACLDPLSFRC